MQEIQIPPGLEPRIERLIESAVRRGDAPEVARRAVEQAVLLRGVAALEADRRTR